MNAKITCSVINDLLPLYIDNVSSSDSRLLVDEHLADCKFCRAAASQMDRPLTLRADTDKAHIAGMKRSVENKNFLRISLLCFGIVMLLMISGGICAYRAYNYWSDSMTELRGFWYIAIPAMQSAAVMIGYVMYIIYNKRRDEENIGELIQKKAYVSYSVFLALCVLFYAGYKLMYLGSPAPNDEIETVTEFQYSEDSYLEQEWVIHFTDKKGKALNVMTETVYKDPDQGDMRRDGVILHVNEVPIKAMMESSSYTFGYSVGDFSWQDVPPGSNFTVTVVYKDKTVTYDMRHEGLFVKQEDVSYAPFSPDTPEAAPSDTTARSANGITTIYDN